MKTTQNCSIGIACHVASGDDTHSSPLTAPAHTSASSPLPDASLCVPAPNHDHDELLAALTTHEQALLAEWFHTTKRLEDVLKKCAELPPKGLGITPSFEALAEWEHKHVRNHIRTRQSRAQELALLLPEPANASPIDPAALHSLKLRLFELSVRPQSDVNEIKTLFLLILEERNHQIAQRKLQIALDEVAADISTKAKFMEPEDLLRHTRRVLGDFADPNRNPAPPLNPAAIPL